MKHVGTAYYTHVSNLEPLFKGIREDDVRFIKHKLRLLPKTAVIKFDTKKRNVSFIESPDWDTAHEPIVGDAHTFSLDNDGYRFTPKRRNNFQIYHCKELFVASDYKGFDIEEAKKRTELWNSIPGIKDLKKVIGNQDTWFKILDENGIER